MKLLQKMLFCVALILATSCSNTPDKVLTVIHADGSCWREFSASADSAFMTGAISEENNPFPVEIDSTYFIAWQYKGGEIRADFPILQSTYDSLLLTDTTSQTSSTDDFLVFASRNYKSVEEMSKEFKLKPSHPWHDMRIKHNFEKKIRFFYSYFTYKETYPQIELPCEVSIENYMSEEEADFWFTGEPNLLQGMNGLEAREYLDGLGEKYEEWFARFMWHSQYGTFIVKYDMIKNPPVSEEDLIRLKDTIFEVSYKNNEIMKLLNEMDVCLDEYFDTKVFSEFAEKENICDEYFGEKIFNFMLGNFNAYQLVMPGEIIYTNGVNRNDTLNWKLTSNRMFRGDYVIEAQSRKLNVWLLVLTGMLAMTAIAIFVYKRKKFKIG